MAIQSLKDVQVFSGGMDGDTETSRIRTDQGDYILLENARNTITNEGNNGSIEDAEGNLLVNNPFLNVYGGTNECIGRFEDKKEQSIIYFIYNSLGYHGIYRWYLNSASSNYGEIQKIWQVKSPQNYDLFNKNPLNFNIDYPIDGVALVGGRFLCWNSYYDEPKQMDVIRANETEKKRKYDFFINQLEISTPIAYTLELFDSNGNSIQTLTFTSNIITSLEDRVADLVSQINNSINIKFSAINKVNYLEIQISEIGEFALVLTDDGSYQSRILPSNFYNSDIPGNFFNRIQAPPFCRPDANYLPVTPGDLVNPTGIFDIYFGSSFNLKGIIIIGIGNKVNDVNNQIALGPNSTKFVAHAANPFPAVDYALVKAWVKLGPGSVTVQYSLQFDVFYQQVSGGGPFGNNAELRFYVCVINNANVVTILSGTNIILPGTTGTLTGQTYTSPVVGIPTNPALGDKVFLMMIVRGCNISTYNGSVTLSPIVGSLGKDAIIKQTGMFRNKFIYENTQKSVYGQATSVILRTEGYNAQNEIEVVFDDKFIQSDNHCSRLKQVVCSYSEDGGKTWYDYDTMDKYRWACENNRKTIFDNQKFKIPVDPAEALLQFHATPLRAKSLEFVDDRIADGGIVEGYDSINVDMEFSFKMMDFKSNLFYASGDLPISVEGFKPGYKGYIGIVYYDDYDRKSGVCLSVNSRIEVPYYPYPLSPNNSSQFIDMTYTVLGIRAKIFNEPPPWATKYRLVRTKDFSQSGYLMWVIKGWGIKSSPTTGLPVTYQINLSNIPYYTEDANPGAIIEYTFVKGDRVKILTNKNGQFLTTASGEILDVEIFDADADNIYIKYDAAIPLDNGGIIELYSKAATPPIEDSLFYEMGECFEIKTGEFGGIKKKYHTGNDPNEPIIDQGYFIGGSNQPAIVESYHGGIYNRIRKYFFNDPNSVTALIPSVEKLWWINSNYADEYQVSKEDGLTRVNAVTNIGQVFLDGAIRITNRFVDGTEINAINENEPLNLVSTDSSLGLITKLVVLNNSILRVIFFNSAQMSFYVSQGVIKQLQGGNALVVSAEGTLNNSFIIQKTLGSQNPESISINDDNDAFGYDQSEAVIWRSSSNGLIQISDNKQKRNFKNWSNIRNKYDKLKSKTPSVYDIYHDEYIVTLRPIPQPQSKKPCTTLSLQEPKEQLTIHIFIEETGQTILPPTVLPLGENVTAYLLNLFNNTVDPPWVATENSDGTIHLCAPDISYNNKTIIINVTPNGIYLGEELIINQLFSTPTWGIDWDAQVWGDWLVENGSNIPVPNSYFPSLLGQFDYARHVPGAGNDTPIYQKNIGLKQGKRYLTIYDAGVVLGDIRIILGSGPAQTNGNLVSASANQITEVLQFDDSNDIVQFLTPDFTSNLAFRNVSVREIMPESYTLKFPLSGGVDYEPLPAVEPITMAFTKAKNLWTHRFTFHPELYGRLNDNVVLFVNGEFWLMHKDAPAKNYFGVQHERKLIMVINREFPKRKVFKALAVNGIGRNAAPTLRIKPFEGVPTGMETELTENHFIVQEGIQNASIQQDKLTPGFSDPNQAWLNGREMRGESMEVTIVNDKSEVSIIKSVEVLYFYSETT